MLRQKGKELGLSVGGVAFKDFVGTLELPGAKTVISRCDELPAIVPEGGRTYTASLENRTTLNVNDALRLAAKADGAADTVTKKGDGELALAADRIPDDVAKLQILAGTLSLCGLPTNGLYAVVTNGTCFNAVFPNPTAENHQYANDESYTVESDRRLKLRSGKNPATIDGWTQPNTSGGTSGYLVLPDAAPTSTWVNGIPEGNQAIFLLSGPSNKVSEVFTTVRFPSAGEYLVSWRESRNYGSDTFGALAYGLKFGKEADGWANAAVIARRTVATGHFPRVYVTVTVAEAGSYIFGFQVDSFHYDYGAGSIKYLGMVVDDFRGDLLARSKSAANVFKIPNGDFEETYRADGVHGGIDLSVLGEGTVATNWTFHQGENWPKEGDAYNCVAVGVSGYAFPRHNSQWVDIGNTGNSGQNLFGRNADVKDGNHMLFLCQGNAVGVGSYAETTFVVPKAGTYLLRAKVSRWNISYLDQDFLGNVEPENGRPYVSAKVSIGGNETDLGTLACDRHVQEDRVWANAFTVAADNATVTLRIAETEKKFGAIVDDLVLVDVGAPALDDGGEEHILNGSFEDGVTLKADGNVDGGAIWTVVRGKKNNGDGGSTPNYYCNLGSVGQQYVKAAYDGEVACNIRGTGEITQKVTLSPGRYRFRFAANSRSNANYDKNGLVIALYNETKTEVKKQIFATDAVTFYNPHVYETEFDLDEGGTFVFSVKGDPHDIEHAAGGEQDNRSSVIDGLSLRKISKVDCRVVPSVPKDLRITVAEGAKLNLDFKGKITTRTLKLGGTGCIGTVSAATHPGYITGDGEIEVEPHSMTIIFR